MEILHPAKRNFDWSIFFLFLICVSCCIVLFKPDYSGGLENLYKSMALSNKPPALLEASVLNALLKDTLNLSHWGKVYFSAAVILNLTTAC